MSLLQRIRQKTRELLRLEEAKPAPAPKPAPKPKVAPLPHGHPEAPKHPTHREGIDYSFGNGLTASEIKRAGKAFVCRYISSGNVAHPNGKDIDKKELQNLLAAGLDVVLVWETTGKRALEGRAAGEEEGRLAKAEADALGLRGIPIYFGETDFDATPGQQHAIDDFCDGVALAIGRQRAGLYGGYWVIKRALDAKKVSRAWQTYAWSGSNWDLRAQLQQYQNGVRLGPAEVDLNRSTAADFGQWPRP